MAKKKKQRKIKRPVGETNLASEYFVASQLARLGHKVEVTRGHLPAIDLFVALKRGPTVTIDVKGVRDKTSWPVWPVHVGEKHFYVFVTYEGKFRQLAALPPPVFVVPSAEVKRLVAKHWKSMKGVPYRRLRDSEYKNAWKLLYGREKDRPKKRRHE
jgi:hypothetical protein